MSNIVVAGSLIPGGIDTPLDARSRVATLEAVAEMQNPVKGAIFYCEADGKHYKITALKSKQIGPLTVENAAVDAYEALPTKSDVDGKAAATHNHDSVYSATDHTHTELHTHANAVALAKFDENAEGKPTYDGAEIGSGVGSGLGGMTDAERARLLPENPSDGDLAIYSASSAGNGCNNTNTKLLLPLITDFSDTSVGSSNYSVTTSESLLIASEGGKFGGGAAEFTGGTAPYIRVALSPAQMTASDSRLSFWFKLTGAGEGTIYVISGMTNFGISSNYIAIFRDNGAWYLQLSNNVYVIFTTLYLSDWNYISYTYYGGKWYAHVNGMRVMNEATAGLTESDTLSFGACSYNNSPRNVAPMLLSEVMFERGDMSSFIGDTIAVPTDAATPAVVSGQWTKINRNELVPTPSWQNLTYASSLALDVTIGKMQKVTLTGDLALTAPTLSVAAPELLLQIDCGTTARTVTLGAETILSVATGVYLLEWYFDGAVTQIKTVSTGGGAAPVRGVDYWTDEDISVIQSYVTTAIENGSW